MSDIMHRLEFYASAFAPEPSDVQFIPDGVVLGEWLAGNIPDFDPERSDIVYSIPLIAPVYGRVVAQIAPEGGVIQSVLKPVFKLLGLAPAKPKTQSQQTRGDDIELAAFQGNQVKYGQPVREIFGMVKVFPDYLVPRRTYFQNKRDHWAEMLLCVGVGRHQIAGSSITFGSTPVIALGGGAYAQVYQPGASLAGEPAAQWWHTSPEVGQTSTGSSGLPLETIYEATPSAPNGTYLVSGFTITPTGGQLFPDDWQAGMYLDIRYLHSYSVSGSTLTGDFSGLQVEAGDTVELDGDYQGSFQVASYTPPAGSTPGSASVWTASAPPSLDYSVTPAQFSVNSGLISGIISISGTYSSEAELVSALNAAVAATSLNGLIIFEPGLVIRELAPYAGWRITVTDLTDASRLLGDIAAGNASTVVGNAASGGSGAKLELVNFVSDAPRVSLSISKAGERFVLTGASPNIITVDRVDESGESDWNGWGAGFETMDIEIGLGADSTQGGWVGTFKATPGNELCDAISFDVFMPQGLMGVDSKGVVWPGGAGIEFRYRSSPDDPWEYFSKRYVETSKDQIGFTETIEFETPRPIVECAMRRTDQESKKPNESNKVEWFGLRTRIVGAPTSYPEFTTVAVRVRGSSAIGTDADEQLGLIATRVLNGVPERRISKAVDYIARRTPVDSAKLAQLEAIWGPRGDTFDHSFENTATVKQAVKTALAVGFADFSMDDGVLSPVRDQAIPPEMMYAYWQTFSAQNTTQPITVTFEMISDDETDGIDVEYMDERTWRVETVRCMRPGSLGLKIEKVKADGIINRDRAYRFGMRELMTRITERERIKTQTELSGLNCGYGQYVNFVSEVPGWGRSSVVKSLQGVILESADELDWQEGAQHVVALRRDDGTLSAVLNVERVTDTRMQVMGSFGFTPTPYRTHLFFGIRERFATPAIMREVRPSGTDRVNLMAIAYNPEKYIYDDAEADN